MYLPSCNSFPNTKQLSLPNVARGSQLQRYPLFLAESKQINKEDNKKQQTIKEITGIEC